MGLTLRVKLNIKGYKDTFSYDKLIQILIWQIIKPGTAMILGGDYRIPVAHGLLEKDFTNEMREDGTFNEVTFAREYLSTWAGTVENSYFSSEMIDKARTLETAEWSANVGRATTAMKEYYVIGVDVARMSGKNGAQTVAVVIKVRPQIATVAIKEVVNIFVWEGEHFDQQSLQIKQLRDEYDAKVIVIDANGNGVGLTDFLIKPTVKKIVSEGRDGNMRETIIQIAPPLEVINDDRYDEFKTDDSLPCLYNLKATNEMNHDIAVNVVSQLSSKKVKFLVDERVIKSKILNSKKLSKMSSSERAKFLKPYLLTSILKDEMMNLREDVNRDNRLSNFKRVNSKIGKDKYSAFSYGLYWIKLEEDKAFGRKKRKSKLIDAVMYSESNNGLRKIRR